MKHKEIKDDIVSLLEKIIERAHRINRQHPSGEHLLDIDLVKDDLRSLYRCFDMLARLSPRSDSSHEDSAADDANPYRADGPAPEGEEGLQQAGGGTEKQAGTTSPAQAPPPAREDAPPAEASLAPDPAESLQGGGEPVRPDTVPLTRHDAPPAETSGRSAPPAASHEGAGLVRPDTASPVDQDTPAAEAPGSSTPAASPRDEPGSGRPGTSPPAEQDDPPVKAASTTEEAGSSKDESGQLTPPASSQTSQDSGEPVPSEPMRPDEPSKIAPRQMVIPVPDDPLEAGKGRQEPGQQAGEKEKGKKNNNQKAVIDILSEYGQLTIGDQYLKEEDDSLHQRIAGQKEDKSIGARMQQHPIGDLKDVIGVNEKFLFINELFGGDIQDYRKAIAELNGMNGIRTAFDYLNQLAVEYSWDAARSASTIEKLANYVQRRHMIRD